MRGIQQDDTYVFIMLRKSPQVLPDDHRNRRVANVARVQQVYAEVACWAGSGFSISSGRFLRYCFESVPELILGMDVSKPCRVQFDLAT